jgi:hypothetical protein
MSARLHLIKVIATVAVPVLTATALARSVEPVPQPASARLTDDMTSRRSLFDVQNASSGDRALKRCIVLRNSGDHPVRVSMRLSHPPLDNGLGSSVQMTVERGVQPWATPGVGCRGFRPVRRDGAFFRGPLDAFPTTQRDAVADGAPVLAPEGRRAYRISWWLSDRARARGARISDVDFVWEASG